VRRRGPPHRIPEQRREHQPHLPGPPGRAVLWTDQDGQWQGTAARLREMLPHLFTLCDYKPEERQGPAI
jgi:hypothetical protein